MRKAVWTRVQQWMETGQVSLQQVLKEVRESIKVMPGFDGWIPKGKRYMGVMGMWWFKCVVEGQVLVWCEATMKVLHLTLVKKPGCNLNLDTRAIKVMSALLRDVTKMENRLLQEWLGACLLYTSELPTKRIV